MTAMKPIALILYAALALVSCGPTPQQVVQPTASDPPPPVVMQAHPDAVMGRKDWICLDSLRVTINPGPPASLTLKDPRCTSVFINERTSPLTEGRACDYGIFMLLTTMVMDATTVHQSVSIDGNKVSFSAQQESGPSIYAAEGSGVMNGSFDMSSGRLQMEGGSPSSSTTDTCHPA
jgi:hypothetical protein